MVPSETQVAPWFYLVMAGALARWQVAKQMLDAQIESADPVSEFVIAPGKVASDSLGISHSSFFPSSDYGFSLRKGDISMGENRGSLHEAVGFHVLADIQ